MLTVISFNFIKYVFVIPAFVFICVIMIAVQTDFKLRISLLTGIYAGIIHFDREIPRKHKILNQSRFNVGPTSVTLA